MKDVPASDPLADRFGPLARHLFDGAPLAEAWRLSVLSNFFTGPLYARLQAEHGLGRPGFVVLYCLGEQGGLMARDVVRASGLPKNSVSRAVTDLIAKGLVVADANGADRRAKSLDLTEHGAALVAELLIAFEARQADLVAALTTAERAALHDLLSKMARHMPDWVDDGGVDDRRRTAEGG